MSSAKGLPSSTEGRLGHLTPAQSQRLKLMWATVFAAGGTLPSNVKSINLGSEPASTKKSGAGGGGLFGLGKKVVSGGDTPPSGVVNPAPLIEACGPVVAKKFFSVFWKTFEVEHPDAALLRYLRARDWDVAKASAMLGGTLKWVEESKLMDVIRGGDSKPLIEGRKGVVNQFTSGKAYIHGTDFQGRPLAIVKVHLHHPRDQSSDDMNYFIMLIIESLRMTLKDPTNTVGVVFDLNNFSMGNMDYDAVRFILKCFESNYPETLGFVLIHRAPWIFSTAWNVIKGWLDPVVAAKIHFTKTTKDLQKLIPDQYIEEDWGGPSKYKYEYIPPVEGENALLADESGVQAAKAQYAAVVTEYQTLALAWIQAEGAESDNLATKRTQAGVKLVKAYHSLDPYVRGRLVFDRNGEFKLQGATA